MEYQQLNDYPNIFGYQRIDWTNIRIYLDRHEMTKWISEYIWAEENQQIWIKNSINRTFLCANTQICVSSLKKGHNWPTFVTNCPNRSRECIWIHKNWPNIHPNLFVGSRIDWTNIQIKSKAYKMTKQIPKYIRFEEKPQIPIQIIFMGHFLEYLSNHADH